MVFLKMLFLVYSLLYTSHLSILKTLLTLPFDKLYTTCEFKINKRVKRKHLKICKSMVSKYMH